MAAVMLNRISHPDFNGRHTAPGEITRRLSGAPQGTSGPALPDLRAGSGSVEERVVTLVTA